MLELNGHIFENNGKNYSKNRNIGTSHRASSTPRQISVKQKTNTKRARSISRVLDRSRTSVEGSARSITGQNIDKAEDSLIKRGYRRNSGVTTYKHRRGYTNSSQLSSSSAKMSEIECPEMLTPNISIKSRKRRIRLQSESISSDQSSRNFQQFFDTLKSTSPSTGKMDLRHSRKKSWKSLNGSIPFSDDSAPIFTVNSLIRFESEAQKAKFLLSIEEIAAFIVKKWRLYLSQRTKMELPFHQDSADTSITMENFKDTLRSDYHTVKDHRTWKYSLRADEFDKFENRNKGWSEAWVHDGQLDFSEFYNLTSTLDEIVKLGSIDGQYVIGSMTSYDMERSRESAKILSESKPSEIDPKFDWERYLKYAIQLLATRYLLQGLESFEEERRCASRVALIQYLLQLCLPEDDQTNLYKCILNMEICRIQFNALKKAYDLVDIYLDCYVRQNLVSNPLVAQTTPSDKLTISTNKDEDIVVSSQENSPSNFQVQAEESELNLNPIEERTGYSADENNPWKKKMEKRLLKSLAYLNKAVTMSDKIKKKIKEKKLKFTPLLRRENLCGDLNVSRNKLELGDTLIVLFEKQFQLPNRNPDIKQLCAILHYFRFAIVDNLYRLNLVSGCDIERILGKDWKNTYKNDLKKAHTLDPLLPNCHWSFALHEHMRGNYFNAATFYRQAASLLEKGNRIRSGLMYEASFNIIKWYLEEKKMDIDVSNQDYDEDIQTLHRKIVSWNQIAQKYHQNAVEYFHRANPLYPFPIIGYEETCSHVQNFLQFAEKASQKSITPMNGESNIGQNQENQTNIIDTSSSKCHVCHISGLEAKLRRCSRCKDNQILYCSEECQFVYWEVKHRFECKG